MAEFVKNQNFRHKLWKVNNQSTSEIYGNFSTFRCPQRTQNKSKTPWSVVSNYFLCKKNFIWSERKKLISFNHWDSLLLIQDFLCKSLFWCNFSLRILNDWVFLYKWIFFQLQNKTCPRKTFDVKQGTFTFCLFLSLKGLKTLSQIYTTCLYLILRVVDKKT